MKCPDCLSKKYFECLIIVETITKANGIEYKRVKKLNLSLFFKTTIARKKNVII
tara:strand:- start:51 stop:212 length:162 start_codon:yes stop_codon:yes gene_type:complete